MHIIMRLYLHKIFFCMFTTSSIYKILMMLMDMFISVMLDKRRRRTLNNEYFNHLKEQTGDIRWKEEEEELMSNVVGGERLKSSQGLHLLPDLRCRVANSKHFCTRIKVSFLTPPNMAKILSIFNIISRESL